MPASDKSKASLDFWYEFASTYSYLSALRIDKVCEAAGVIVRWRPFLLGPIFQAQGWSTSPFNLYPAKGRYMVRDMERRARLLGLDFHLPSPFPQNGLLAARIALVGCEEGFVSAFSRATFQAEFAERQDISSSDVIARTLDLLGLQSQRILARAATVEIKDRLKTETQMAQSLGIFGAPSFVTGDGELFWGDDRLDDAVAWAAGF